MTDTIDGLKQRLVGAFVILSLAVIFLPMIFDKPHTTTKTEYVPVPPKPELKPVEVKEPRKPDFERLAIDPEDGRAKTDREIADKRREAVAIAAEAQNEEANGSATQSAPVEKVESKSNRSEKPTVSHLPAFKNVWMVQLGTFGNKKNAYRLRDKLREDGFDGHTKKVEMDGKQAIRVFTGPFVNKREAERIKKKLDTRYRVDSLIVFFDA